MPGGASPGPSSRTALRPGPVGGGGGGTGGRAPAGGCPPPGRRDGAVCQVPCFRLPLGPRSLNLCLCRREGLGCPLHGREARLGVSGRKVPQGRRSEGGVSWRCCWPLSPPPHPPLVSGPGGLCRRPPPWEPLVGDWEAGGLRGTPSSWNRPPPPPPTVADLVFVRLADLHAVFKHN